MNKNTYSTSFFIILFIFSSILFNGSTPPEEGMYPLSEISNINLVEAGLKIEPTDIYNPNGTSLIDAMVRIPGCTGSFVSNKGLILTNHHCGFEHIRAVSTIENNLLENGFLAKTHQEEIPAEEMHAMIIDSYEDVSQQILEVIEGKPFNQKRELIDEKIEEIIKQTENENPEITAEVSEMFIGQTYILFKYRTIQDVRIVYAPPKCIGNFGGETDNWMWPRHTGDFSFFRAYVAPDGSFSEYSEDNVPYVPKKHFKVNYKGAKEGDFTFILGYPGKTYRHYPSYYVKYHQKYRLPFISKVFRGMIDDYDALSAKDPEFGLSVASRVRSLANVMKNYEGKLLGMRRLELVEKKEKEEKELQNFIKSDESLQEEYGTLLQDLENTYETMFELGRQPIFHWVITRVSRIYWLAAIYNEFQDEMEKPEDERSFSNIDEFLQKNEDEINYYFDGINLNGEKIALENLLSDAVQYADFQDFTFYKILKEHSSTPEELQKFVYDAVLNSVLSDKGRFINFIKQSYNVKNYEKDIMLNILMSYKNEFEQSDEIIDEVEGKLTSLLAKLVDVKRQWKKQSFVPDANFTMRLTYGYVKGYSPADAIRMNPHTTISGLIEKANTGNIEYCLPDKLRTLYNEQDYGVFEDEELGSVPVCLLYNMDTTGGNSGSPILNAYGELIGLNFDRAYEATINDYAWSEDYSRSIGVDIRYILWIAQKLSGADNLVKEMGVEG